MAEVNCVALKDIRTFCHATRFRFSHKILKVLSVDSLLFLSELHLTLQLRFNFKESVCMNFSFVVLEIVCLLGMYEF